MKKKYNFSGGIKCLSIKEELDKYIIYHIPNPNKFYMYIQHNTFKNNMLRVRINQKVLCGEPLTFGDKSSVPIHSPTSGWIKSIELDSHSISSKKKYIKITIVSDYLNQWIRLKKINDYKLYSPKSLIKIIYQLGVVGLGGAHFSSSEKLILGINSKVHTLVVNAVESDPYITADYCLMTNCLSEIFIGCEIITWISKVTNILIVIQEDKIELISKIQSLIKNKKLFKVCILKKKYPGGSSKIIIKSLTGKDIPYGKHSIDIGYLIFNVSTIYAIKKAIINGKPLIQRIVSLYNHRNHSFKNVLIKIGTPINFLLNFLKINNSSNDIYIGGLFMKYLLMNLNQPILKDTNCILITKHTRNVKKNINYECINCGYCVQVCPVNLLPQKLYLYSKNNNHEKTKESFIMDCIECNICEQICPSNIPLVTYFKHEKFIQNQIDKENKKKKEFFYRFQLREKRILNQKKSFYQNKNDFNNTDLTNTNILNKKTNKNFINQKQIDKNIRKEILRSSIERAKLKNKNL
ncbi:electron transport complex subunit RsxC [Buchnera aphidicola]|uniref:Ion-translocating oxidoreductase complex subunit C n=1 Tax=Buchnera aphidicola (Aphis aurantii) TaxID=1470492 RepID=A0AAU6W6C2_9GAMM